MNFLAHIYVVRDSDELMLGGLLGDFVRGRWALKNYPKGVREGIKLHRKVDRFTDATPEFKALRKQFSRPFRRYAGIIIDLAWDHELARRWDEYSDQPLEDFDREVRAMLARYKELVPERLDRFMDYADRHGLFATYRDEKEMLHSLSGIGRRMRRSNPLHRVDEIWPQIKKPCAESFELFFPRLLEQVDYLRNRKSTNTGS